MQFGARAELFFGFDALSVEGHLGFDALFQFSPFYFIVTISASLSVKVFGVGAVRRPLPRLRSKAPTPWHVEGTGTISLLFWSTSTSTSHTWGDTDDTRLPPIAVMPILAAEFEKVENWRRELADANQPARHAARRSTRAPSWCCIRSARCRSASAPCRST